MVVQFTENQTRVLNARRHNVLVSAAAGSGKTAVLVERIIRMISEDDPPLDIDRLLVVTFTRAAAAQMRERIAKAISQRLADHPDDRHLQRQETLLHRAQITTIDSFCAFLLRNNCSEIDLDPGFRQIDENEAALLEGDCLKRFLEEQYAAAQSCAAPETETQGAEMQGSAPAAGARMVRQFEAQGAEMRGSAPAGVVDRERFFACVEYFCPGGSDAGLEKLIRRLYEEASSHAWPKAWLEERKGDYAVSSEEELVSCGWYRQLLRDRLEILRETQRQFEALTALCRESDGPDVYLETIEAEAEGLYAGLRAWEARQPRQGGFGEDTEKGAGEDTNGEDTNGDSEDSAEECFRLRALLLEASQFPFGRLPAVRKKADKARIDPGKQKQAQELRSGIKDRIRGLGEGISEEPEVTVRRMQEAEGPIETLIDLTLGYMAALSAVKKERNVIDFNDLEHYALQVLIDRAPDGTLTLRRAALSYRAYYDEVLIDEYQDSNEVQELLLTAITGEPSAGFADAARDADDAAPAAEGNADAGSGAKYDGRPASLGSGKEMPGRESTPGRTSAEGGSYARFMVGDVKQSIYRFRNARPEIFQRKFDTYAVAGAEEDAAPLLTERIDLDQNFRSRTEVLDAANGVCSQIMRREIGGVEYDEAVSLKSGASYPEPVPERDGSDPYQAELLLVDGQKKSSGGDAVGGGAAGSADPENRAGGSGAGSSQRAGQQGGSDAGGAQDAGAGTDAPEGEEGTDEILEEIRQMNSARKEALAVAQRIHEIVGMLPVYDRDSGTQHPARYRDIVILMRAASGRQDAYREVFEKEGIPLYLEYKGGYFSAGEVRTVLQLLRVIDNPRQDIPLYRVMSSYFGGFTQDEIAAIRALGRDAETQAQRQAQRQTPEEAQGNTQEETQRAAQGETPEEAKREIQNAQPGDPAPSSSQTVIGQSGVEGGKLYGSLLLAAKPAGPEQTPDRPDESNTTGTLFYRELREKCGRFLARLNAWRELSRTMTVRELIGHLIRSTGYEDYVRALPAGQRRAANLRALLVKADAFEKTDRSGLFRFLRYIEEMHAFDVDDGEASVIDEYADVVRLTTIHKSKGLEYPICFVCGLGSKLGYKRDTSGPLILDADLGIGAVYTDAALRCSVKTLRQRAVADKIDRDGLGEELRVLYVAMTRAEEKLILTGYTEDAAELLDRIRMRLAAADRSAAHLPVSLIRGAGNYLNLVLESMEMLRAKGQEPIRLRTVPVSDLRLAELEDQQTMSELRGALLLAGQGDLSQLPSPETARRLERQFASRYPYENLSGLYTKTTVTELKRAAMVDDGRLEDAGEPPAEMYPVSASDELPVPGFASDLPEEASPLTGAGRGTAVHRMCELIDYRVWSDPSAVTERMFTERVGALLGAGEIPPSYAPVLTARTFLPFLHSDIASRMAAADAKGLLSREQPFVLGIAANRLNPEFPEEETILIQGIIDAFFIEEDAAGAETETRMNDVPEERYCAETGRHIVLVDYKTDRVRTGQGLIDRYRVQIDCYAEALERMLRLPVTERILYSFALQEEICL